MTCYYLIDLKKAHRLVRSISVDFSVLYTSTSQFHSAINRVELGATEAKRRCCAINAVRHGASLMRIVGILPQHQIADENSRRGEFTASSLLCCASRAFHYSYTVYEIQMH